MPASNPDLILSNAGVVTLNARQPTAELVAVRGGRIAWVGSNSDLRWLASPQTRIVDCRGQTVVPGFIDAHCHVMAYASSLLAVDCSPAAVKSIADLKRALSERASGTPPGQWVRGTRYDEFALEDKRHPTRRDLDEAVPDHPVRLSHRSGHACVLNSAGLASVGILVDTPDPPAGVIERDRESGEPNGLLMEMNEYLGTRIPPAGERERQLGIRRASDSLVSRGITSLADATHTNSPARFEAIKRFKAAGWLSPRITVMPGTQHLEAFLARGLTFGSGDDEVKIGAAKIMLTATTGTLRPSREELRRMVGNAHDAGFPVAIHAVEAEAVDAAVSALTDDPARSFGARDRIEHCSECPPALLDRLAGSGAAVVTQPGFLYYSGRRYLSEVARDMQPWLYRIRSFLKSGLNPAASSDAPVVDPDPLVGMYAAVTRRADTGESVIASEGISALEALCMYTLNGARALSQDAQKGSIEEGKLADLALLDQDPTSTEPDRMRHIEVTMTLIGGRIVYQA